MQIETLLLYAQRKISVLMLRVWIL